MLVVLFRGVNFRLLIQIVFFRGKNYLRYAHLVPFDDFYVIVRCRAIYLTRSLTPRLLPSQPCYKTQQSGHTIRFKRSLLIYNHISRLFTHPRPVANLNEHILLRRWRAKYHVAVNTTRYGLERFLTKNNLLKLLSLLAIWDTFRKLDNLRCTCNNDDIKQCSMPIGLNFFTLRGDQYINSPDDLYTLASRQVMRINTIVNCQFCLGTTPNSQEYATKNAWS